MERWEDKGKGVWTYRRSKLWRDKYRRKLMEDKVCLVRFVRQTQVGALVSDTSE